MNKTDYNLEYFDLTPGENIIGIRAHHNGEQDSQIYNFQFLIGSKKEIKEMEEIFRTEKIGVVTFWE